MIDDMSGGGWTDPVEPEMDILVQAPEPVVR